VKKELIRQCKPQNAHKDRTSKIKD